MDQMRTAVRQCYGWSLPYGVCVHSANDFDEAGGIQNGAAFRRLNMAGRAVVVYGALLRRQSLDDVAGQTANTFARA
jgi:FMN reductase